MVAPRIIVLSLLLLIATKLNLTSHKNSTVFDQLAQGTEAVRISAQAFFVSAQRDPFVMGATSGAHRVADSATRHRADRLDTPLLDQLIVQLSSRLDHVAFGAAARVELARWFVSFPWVELIVVEAPLTVVLFLVRIVGPVGRRRRTLKKKLHGWDGRAADHVDDFRVWNFCDHPDTVLSSVTSSSGGFRLCP